MAPNVAPATASEGGQPLEYRLDDGVKVFELTTEMDITPVLWYTDTALLIVGS